VDVPGSSLIPSPAVEPTDRPDADRIALRGRLSEACRAWLRRSTSADTRSNYQRDLEQFLTFVGGGPDRLEALARVKPEEVAGWRDSLLAAGLANSSVCRKLSVLRGLYSFLQTYGYTGANPAHGDFVAAPKTRRDGKTVALSPAACRRLLDAPDPASPQGIRDRAIFAVLAYTGCRVGELTRLKVSGYKMSGVHRLLEIYGKGGRERRVPLHLEAAERLELWIDAAGIREDRAGPLFRPRASARGTGFAARPLTRRSVQRSVEAWVGRLGLDANVTVHSLRVTALTTAREAGSDVIDLQDFAGHADPRTTLTYIRNRDRLHKSPAYVLKY
jgi:integrase/recombinase XerD